MINSPKRPRNTRRHLSLESLEERVVMDATFRWASPIAATAPAAPLSQAKTVAFASDGSVYVAGSGRDVLSFGSSVGAPTVSSPLAGQESAYLAKYSPTGALIFASPIPDGGGAGIAAVNSVAIDGTGNLYLGTRTKSGLGAVLKLDGNGGLIWADAIIGGASTINTVNDVTIDNKGDLVAAGTFIGQNVDFDPGPGQTLLSSYATFGEAFVAKYKPSGSLVFAVATQGFASNNVVGNAVSTDGNGDIYLAGGFNGSVDFNPGSAVGENVLTSPSALDPFMIRLTSTGQFIFGRTVQGQVGAGASLRVSQATDVLVEGQSVYLAGSLTGLAIVDFTGNPSVPVTINAGTAGSAFVVKYNTFVNVPGTSTVDKALDYQWTTLASGGASTGDRLVSDGKGNFTLAGTYRGIVQFNAAPNQAQATSRGKDVFLARFNATGRVVGLTGLLAGNDPFSEFAEGAISVSGLAVQPSTGDLAIAGNYSGSSLAPSGAAAPSSKFGSIMLPELGRQGGLAAGESANVFVGRLAAVPASPVLANAPFMLPQDDTGTIGDFVTFTAQPRITGIATPGSVVNLVNLSTGEPESTAIAGTNGQYLLQASAKATGAGPQIYVVRIVDAGHFYPSAPFVMTVGFNIVGGGGGGGTPGGNPGGGGTPVPTPPSGPVVRSTQLSTVRLRPRGPRQTVVVVDFDGVFQAATVQNLGEYTLVNAGRDRRFNTRDDRTIGFRSLSYNAGSRSVTLSPRGRLRRNLVLRLTVTGLAGGTPSVTFLGRPARG